MPGPEKVGYQPSSEEMEKAEEMMTQDEKKSSEERSEDLGEDITALLAYIYNEVTPGVKEKIKTQIEKDPQIRTLFEQVKNTKNGIETIFNNLNNVYTNRIPDAPDVARMVTWYRCNELTAVILRHCRAEREE